MSTESVVRVIAAVPVRHARATKLVRQMACVRLSHSILIQIMIAIRRASHHADKLENVMGNEHARFIHQSQFAEVRIVRVIYVMR